LNENGNAFSQYVHYRKKAFEAALLAEHWRVKYDEIKWPKSGKAFGSRKSMVCAQ